MPKRMNLSARTSISSDYRLTDLELCRFLDLGYHILEPKGIRTDLHAELFEAAERLYAQRREIKNPMDSLSAISDNLHVSVPSLNEILESEVLDGALTSVLGERYFRYPHSFIHASGKHDQTFHKDSPLPWGSRGGLRSHRPNWAMVFYYPQETTIDMGATEVLPGTQYWNVDREKDDRPEGEDRLAMSCSNQQLQQMNPVERDEHLYRSIKHLDHDVKPLKLEVPEGALVLVHFDLFHRGTRATVDVPRFMYKFWYVRTTEPTQPKPKRSFTYVAEDLRRQPCVASQAEWLGISVPTNQSSFSEDCTDHDSHTLARNYQLIRTDTEGVLRDLQSGTENLRRNAMYALVSAGQRAVAVAHSMSSSENEPERSAAAFLLGETARLDEEVAKTLMDLIECDQSDDVRMSAINATGRIIRRTLAGVHDSSNISDCVRSVFQQLRSTSIQRSRSGVFQNPLRQCVYIAGLNIVTSLLNKEAYSDLIEWIAEVVCKSVIDEKDRFGKGTGMEIVARLAEVGVVEAVQTSLTLLRRERWSVVEA